MNYLVRGVTRTSFYCVTRNKWCGCGFMTIHHFSLVTGWRVGGPWVLFIIRNGAYLRFYLMVILYWNTTYFIHIYINPTSNDTRKTKQRLYWRSNFIYFLYKFYILLFILKLQRNKMKQKRYYAFYFIIALIYKQYENFTQYFNYTQEKHFYNLCPLISI